MRTSILISAFLLVTLASISCGESEPTKRNNQIYRIVVATGACFGTCPVQTFSIDSSLQLNYCGYYNTKDTGCSKGVIDTTAWNEINSKLESIHYLELDSIWAENTVDAPSFEIVIYHSRGVKRIRSFNYGAFPKDLQAVFDRLENIAVSTQKTPCGSIMFEDFQVDRPPLMDSVIQFTVPN